jgi:hypothetical protein
MSGPGSHAAEARADAAAERVMVPGPAARPAELGVAPASPGPVPAHVREVVAGSGRPLDAGAAARFAERAGHDVGQVRIHTGAEAGASARRLGALAYTLGRDVVLGGNVGGDGLLNHELAHVVQQARSGPALQLQDDPEAAPEPEAAPGPVPDEDTDVAEPAPPEPAPPPDVGQPAPVSITGSVGRRGVNAPADVAVVQDRLLAIGVLSAEDVAAERPPAADGGTAPAPVPEANLVATIAALERFQQPLGFSDGNAGPAGPTWRALVRLDAAAFAARRQAWLDEQARLAAAPPAPAPEPAAAPQPDPAKAAEVTARQVTALIGKYSTYVAGISVSLDEAGLGVAVRSFATSNPAFVIAVLDALSWGDRDDVAYEMVQGLTDDQVAVLSPELAERLAAELGGGWRSKAELAQVTRLTRTDAVAVLAPPQEGEAAVRTGPGPDDLTGPALDAGTLEDRVVQIRAFYDKYWVSRTTTDNCHLAAKAALEKMGWTVGGSDTLLFPTPLGDGKLTADQNTQLRDAILAEIMAGRPVEIGVDYHAGNPGNADTKTDHWLYAVAVTRDDSGQLVLVAYDNADVASSKITKGNVVYFTLDEMGAFYHPAYFPTSKKDFSNRPHLIVNFRPAQPLP